MSDLIDLRAIANIARSSELHNLKVGLTPDEADSIAQEIERLTAENGRLKLVTSTDGNIIRSLRAEIERQNKRLEANERAIASYQNDELGILRDNERLTADLKYHSEASMKLMFQAQRLRAALDCARIAIRTLPDDALGYGYAQDDSHRWPFRDELLDQMDAALQGDSDSQHKDPDDCEHVWLEGIPSEYCAKCPATRIPQHKDPDDKESK